MEKDEEDDLQLIKASSQLLDDIGRALPKLLCKTTKTGSQLHRYVRRKGLERLIGLIEPFQGEPQLLDARLKRYLPPLVDAALQCLTTDAKLPDRDGCLRLDIGIARVLYTFCKIRGEKVITEFFNNEPRYLDTILGSLERVTDTSEDSGHSWHLSYVLLLWLRHLLLAPFDLSTVSVGLCKSNETHFRDIEALPVPPNCPQVILRVLGQVQIYLGAITREQDAAAKILVRLVCRPDVQQTDLHTLCVQHACQRVLSAISAESGESTMGLFRFLVGISSNQDCASQPPVSSAIKSLITELHQHLFDTPHAQSAVLRKLYIKLVRNTAITRLKVQPHVNEDDNDDDIIEDSANYLMVALSDRDTQVRCVAAKAMGQLVSKLDVDFAEQLMDAVVDEFDLAPDNSVFDFSTADASKWHGLTLALAYLLFQRSFKPKSLHVAVRVLVQALNFEKRSGTGSTEGTGVRDAACFAIWSMSRRYTSEELDAATITGTLGFSTSGKGAELPTIQMLAVQLISSSCLDPSGNVRRGCSAALQELVGRHPDQVPEGIALIQIIDYQAVGLRRRAMTDLVIRTAELHDQYWRSLLEDLQGWRGIGSLDIASREWAARSIGLLCARHPAPGLGLAERLWDRAMLGRRILTLERDGARREQHGALLALSDITANLLSLAETDDTTEGEFSTKNGHKTPSQDMNQALSQLGRLCSRLDDFEVFYPLCRDQRMDMSGIKADVPVAVAKLLTQIIKFNKTIRLDGAIPEQSMKVVADTTAGLLRHSEESLLATIPQLVAAILRNDGATQHELLRLSAVVEQVKDAVSRPVVNCASAVFALASAVPLRLRKTDGGNWKALAQPLVDLVTNPVIDWRVIGLRAIRVVLETTQEVGKPADEVSPSKQDEQTAIPSPAPNRDDPSPLVTFLIRSLDAGLNDYTINERGDVGSLARIQALHCSRQIWRAGLIEVGSAEDRSLLASVLRLSMEKLDRTRLLSAQAICSRLAPTAPLSKTLADVSSESYFLTTLQPLINPHTEEWVTGALIRGLASATSGADPLAQAALSAFVLVAQDTSMDSHRADRVLAALSDSLNWHLSTDTNPEPLLSLLAFALDSTPLAAMVSSAFPWRTLLSRVQKSHFKSSIVPKLTLATGVYRALARIDVLRPEVLKKLASMVRTNPFPRVRYAAAEMLWVVTGARGMEEHDWTKTGKENGVVLDRVNGLV